VILVRISRLCLECVKHRLFVYSEAAACIHVVDGIRCLSWSLKACISSVHPTQRSLFLRNRASSETRRLPLDTRCWPVHCSEIGRYRQCGPFLSRGCKLPARCLLILACIFGTAGEWDARFGPATTSMVDRQRGRTSPAVPMPHRSYKALVRYLSFQTGLGALQSVPLKVSVTVNDVSQGHFTQASS